MKLGKRKRSYTVEPVRSPLQRKEGTRPEPRVVAASRPRTKARV